MFSESHLDLILKLLEGVEEQLQLFGDQAHAQGVALEQSAL
jgi:hypothetical protein